MLVFILSASFYKDNTVFLITTDHGRGSKPSKWYTHNTFTTGSGEIWLALLGKNILPAGEMNDPQKIFQNQIASTISGLLGQNFQSNVTIGKKITLPVMPVARK